MDGKSPVLTALAIVMAGFLSVTANAGPSHAVVKVLVGSAQCADALGELRILRVGDSLKEGDTIMTGPESQVGLFLEQNGVGISLESKTTLHFEKLTSTKGDAGTVAETKLELKQGAMYASVEALAGGSRFEIKTPRGTANAKASKFYVNAQDGAFLVLSGTVVLSSDSSVTGESNSHQSELSAGSVIMHAGEFIVLHPSEVISTSHDTASSLAETSTIRPENVRAITKDDLHKIAPLAGTVGDDSFTLHMSQSFNSGYADKGTKSAISKPPSSAVISP